jgi:hypothetical protein
MNEEEGGGRRRRESRTSEEWEGAPIRVNDFTHFSVDKVVEGVDMLPHQPAHLTLVSHATK